MDNIDINNIRYLQVLIPKLDDSSNIDSSRQDDGNINEQLLDSMMSGLLEDDSSMELPPSMTGKKTLSKHADKNENTQKRVKKHSCPVCKRTFKDENLLQQHSKVSGHHNGNVSSKTPMKRMNKCLTCGQRFKDKETMSFHCAARGHIDPNENTAPKNRSPATSTVRKKPNGRQQQKVWLQCKECFRKFKDTEALNFHYAMSGHDNSNEEVTDEDDNEKKETKTIAIKLPCGGCNKKFKDCKSLDLHLALSGHPDKREKVEKSDKIQPEKRQSEKRESEKQQSERKQSEKTQSEKKEYEKKEYVKKQSEKKQSEKRQSQKSRSEMNGKRKSSTDGDEKIQHSTDSKILNCSGCRKKFKSINELQMHCALSGHTQDVVIETKKSTSIKKKSKDEDLKETKVLKNGRSQNQGQTKAKNSYNLNCFECGKKFKTLEMLNYHEAFSGHTTQEENDENDENKSDQKDENDTKYSSDETETEQDQIVNEEARNTCVDILCSVCSRKFKDKNALYYHMAISGHGASKLGSDRAVKVKPRSRICDLTSSDSSSEESDLDEIEEEKPDAKSVTKPRCATCKKQFKDTKTLDVHIALSGHSNSATKKKRGRSARNASNKRKETTEKCTVNATLGVGRKRRGRPKKVQISDAEETEDEGSNCESVKDQKRQCGECGRKCKDRHAYEYHCAMTGHGSTAVISLQKMDLSACKRQQLSEDGQSSGDESSNSPPRKKRKIKRDFSDDDSDYEGGASRVRSYQSFMEEASVWDKWNPKKGIPCRRCGLMFKRSDELKRHLLTTSHKTNVIE